MGVTVEGVCPRVRRLLRVMVLPTATLPSPAGHHPCGRPLWRPVWCPVVPVSRGRARLMCATAGPRAWGIRLRSKAWLSFSCSIR